MIFATIEDNASGQSIEVVVFNSVLEKTSSAWVENACVIVDGRVSRRDGETKMLCENAKRLELTKLISSPSSAGRTPSRGSACP